MRLGFTGTQRGMTMRQIEALARWLKTQRFTEAHHGDCVGADAEFDVLLHALWLGGAKFTTVIHPPDNPSKRAFCIRRSGERPVIERPPKPYLVRNRDIVDETDALVSGPGETVEVLRSGTWMTTRYGLKRRRPVRAFWPGGESSRLDDD